MSSGTSNHSFPPSARVPGACPSVGRIGTLAFALGIGAAIATGMGAGVAFADQQDLGTASAEQASPQTVRSGNSPKTGTARTGPASRGAAKASEATPNPAAARRVAARMAPADPAAVSRSSSDTAPSAHPVITATPPVGLSVAAVSRSPLVIPAVAALKVPAASLAAATAGAAPLAAATAGVAPWAAATASPTVYAAASALAVPAANAVATAAPRPVALMVTNVLARLAAAISGNTQWVPADAGVGLMAMGARRKAATAAASSGTTPSAEGELLKGAGTVVSDNTASSKKALKLVTSGTASTTLNIVASTALTVTAKAGSGPSTMTVSIDGTPITTILVKSTSYTDYTFAGAIPAGKHTVSVSSSSATSSNPLYIDTLSTSTAAIGDQFSGKAGSALSKFWKKTIGTGWDPGVQNYTDGGVYLDGQGHVVIQATKTSTGGYTSGRIETANTLSLGYGTITARIQVPQGQGLWPAFWLMGADSAITGWPQAGEIDVMELPSTTTTMYSTLHGPIDGTNATQQAQVISQLPNLSTGYHNYWVSHLENQITFGVDGQTLGTLTPADLAPGETWVYNRPMYVILNLAVGGSWAGAPDSTTPTVSTMTVDSLTWTAA